MVAMSSVCWVLTLRSERLAISAETLLTSVFGAVLSGAAASAGICLTATGRCWSCPCSLPQHKKPSSSWKSAELRVLTPHGSLGEYRGNTALQDRLMPGLGVMEPDNKLLIFLLALISPFKLEASSGPGVERRRPETLSRAGAVSPASLKKARLAFNAQYQFPLIWLMPELLCSGPLVTIHLDSAQTTHVSRDIDISQARLRSCPVESAALANPAFPLPSPEAVGLVSSPLPCLEAEEGQDELWSSFSLLRMELPWGL